MLRDANMSTCRASTAGVCSLYVQAALLCPAGYMVICSRMSGGVNGCPDNVDGTLQAAGLKHTPGTLFALPLIDFPAGFIKAFIDWELPKGRHQDDHYLHPAIPLVSRRPSPFESDCSHSLGVFRLHAGSTEMAMLAVVPLAGLAPKF